MLARVHSGAIVGLDGAVVRVEADYSGGIPRFDVVGLPDTAVQEARERVRYAIRNSGATFPAKRVVVSLAPADLKKAGPAYDLPIAIGILLSTEQVSAETDDTMFLGELSLDGSLRHTNGILPLVALAKDEGFKNVVVPEADAREAALVEGINVIAMQSLSQLIAYLRGDIPAPAVPDNDGHAAPELLMPHTDMSHIKGQEHVKRALEVAAAGAHNVVMN